MKLKRNLIGIFSFCTIAILILTWGMYSSRSQDNAYNVDKATDNSILLVKLSNKDLSLEAAVSNEKHGYGLMNRESMDYNKGMIFIFEKERPLTFYMKDTLVSLDIIYLDANLEVIDIHKNTKPNQTSELYPAKRNAKYAIEVNAGWSEESGLEIGDNLEIVQIIE